MTWAQRDRYYVYVLLDDEGGAVYVGQSGCVGARIGQHARHSPWWRYVADLHIVGPFTTRPAAVAAEDDLIWTLGPLANKPSVADYAHFGLDYTECIDTPTTLRWRARFTSTPSALPSAGARTA